MKRREILPIDVYEFHCDDVQPIIDALDSIQFVRSNNPQHHDLASISKDTLLHRTIPELGRFIDACNAELWAEIGTDDTKLVTTEAWATLCEPGQRHHQHYHVNSYASGILYLADHNQATRLSGPDPWNTFNVCPHLDTAMEREVHSKAVAGKSIMFPSSIRHHVGSNELVSNRATIAWNTFPAGKMRILGSLAYLEIEVK
jgi:uncharacterized protein (TIGR02466 family)